MLDYCPLELFIANTRKDLDHDDHECHHDFLGGRKHNSGPIQSRFSTMKSIGTFKKIEIIPLRFICAIGVRSSEFFVGASNSGIIWLVYLDGLALSWHCNMCAVFSLLSTQGCKLKKLITWSKHNA